MSWHVYHVGYGTILLFPNQWIHLHLASIFSGYFRNRQLLRAEDTNQASYLHLNLSICGQPGQTQGFLSDPWRGCYGFKNNGMIFFFFPLKELRNFPAASGSSSSPLSTFGSGVGWGGDVALLLALVTFCERIIFFTLRIKLEDKCLGILLSIFHGCGMVVSSVGNWCPSKFCFNFIIYRTGRWESTHFK